MTKNQPTLEQQLAALSSQVQQLSARVAKLELTGTTASLSSPAQSAKPTEKEELMPTEANLLVGSSSLLQHISAVCFLLVAALGLRALTDSDMLDLQLGTALGIGYAAAMIMIGYLLYRKKQSMAPIFITIGGLLMCSVLVETYIRFAAIPVELVYIMLAVTGISMAIISYTTHTALPIIVGTFGMCLAAVAIDYPNPYFPYLGLVLWLANVLGYFASRLKRCSWLRWLLLFTTHFMLQIWGMKLTGLLSRGNAAEHLSPNWFIPIVALIGGTFMLIALFGIIRSGDEKVSKFDFSLPAVNAGWCYIAGIYALKDPTLFGSPAAAAAIVHFALAYWLSRRQSSNAQGTNTFTAGGLILACLSLPALFGNMLLPLPLLSILAIATCYFSCRWASGGMRITSYLLQAYISVIFAIEFIGGIEDQQRTTATLMVTIICSMIAVGHYFYARSTKPPEHSQIFARYDKRDQAALLPLFAGLVDSFFSCMLLAHYALRHYYSDDMTFALTGTQSIIINLAAIFIMIRAFFHDNTELRNVAILVLVIGGAKVFVMDMFSISGAWLVCSIFTFGIAAALASLVLARWKTEPADQHLGKTSRKKD